MTTYAPYEDADTGHNGRPRIRVHCSHCRARHWYPITRNVTCPRTSLPLVITWTALNEARRTTHGTRRGDDAHRP